MMDFLLEGLIPTVAVMDVRTANKIVDINAPKLATKNTKMKTKVTIEESGRDRVVTETNHIVYDWDNCVNYSGERNVITRTLLSAEKDGLQERDEKTKVTVVRRMDMRVDKPEVEVDCYKVIAVAANYAGYSRRVSRCSKFTLAKTFARLQKMVKKGDRVLSTRLTIPGR